MLRLSLAQMRRSAGRLVAAGIAIAIGAAFVAASLLGGSVIRSTAAQSLTATLGDADVVVTGWDANQRLLEKIDELPGASATFGQISSFEQVQFNGRSEFIILNSTTPHDQLAVLSIAQGAAPESHNEIALAPGTADRLGVEVGDEITVPISTYEVDDDGEYHESSHDYRLHVTGISSDDHGAFISHGGSSIVTEETQKEFLDWDPEYSSFDQITVAAAVGSSPDELSAQIKSLIDSDYPQTDLQVRTSAEQVEHATQQVTGDTNILLIVVLAFAIVALFVAGLVITNTFQVLIAQRTRQLALLRCVGATRGQVSRSVTIESFILGITAATVGLILGASLVQGTLMFLGSSTAPVPLPDSIELTLVNILVPIITGTVVTLLAAIGPARAATRVAPLAALRPTTAPQIRSTAGKFRLGISLLGMLGGGALLIFGVVAAGREPLLGFFIAVLGGMTSFIGVIIGAVFVIPRVVGFFGGIAGRLTGATAKIATANTVRNPRRTAATATALLIGVTLVTMMSTGAAIARSTLNSALVDLYPVDIAVGDVAADSPEINPRIAAEISKLEGIDTIVEIPQETVQVSVTAGGGTIAPEGTEIVAATIDAAAQTGAIAQSESVPVASGSVYVGSANTHEFGIDGDNPVETITVSGPEGEKSLTVAGTLPHVPMGLVLNEADFEEIIGAGEVHALWMSVQDSHPVLDTYSAVSERVSELTEGTDTSYMIAGSASERAMFEQVIDTLLLIVVGLLAVAVVIALIGVANTLSLSVIERRRESALLRALGLTKRRLRSMLAIEALLITGAGALLGVLLGLAYGYAGASVIFGQFTGSGMQVSLPWRDIVIVLVVALGAGLLASVMPARSATKASPVSALAEE